MFQLKLVKVCIRHLKNILPFIIHVGIMLRFYVINYSEQSLNGLHYAYGQMGFGQNQMPLVTDKINYEQSD